MSWRDIPEHSDKVKAFALLLLWLVRSDEKSTENEILDALLVCHRAGCSNAALVQMNGGTYEDYKDLD